MNTWSKGRFQVLGKNGWKDQSKQKIPRASIQNYPPPSSLFQVPRLSALFSYHTFKFSRTRHPYKSRYPPSPTKKRETNKQNNSMLKLRVWEFTTAKGHFCDDTAWCVMRTMDEKSTKWNKASLEAHQYTLWSIFILRYNVMCYFFTLIAELRGWDTWTLPPTFELLFWMPPKALLKSGD